ncbi:hypothetical protein L291_2665 [Acinetobacter guillouiae MSP4-18]|uniref:DNA phosphorothioation-associated DGQHR protein 1 n=1 Tax=Acinetobacter guillouiae TaxID=106649 RepID=UPI0002D0B6C0|nr:DNA phosphorothioation-associated DGQHR protein 1 [Acinetobacter guillouiae]ENU60077.1 DNA phosphorothioation-associated DGQHR protein 1 [Acinetobacter guillouiae CIP 63.46]EPH38565.1 hypothetical protein L291_2665 [Acinetobacter guillouiae MSP4-18]KAB0629477.1 DGQHR domain-containing protein [Acinetobacter guillouiae]
MQFPITVPAIKIKQPLGTFYAVSLPAEVLLETCFSDRMCAQKELVGYSLKGTQRVTRDNRLQQIAEYIDRVDSAFPNSIILAANYHETGYTLEEYLEIQSESDSSDYETQLLSSEWKITHLGEKLYELTIPSPKKLAAIIDGQHRLFGFASKHLQNPERLQMELLCSIYVDLPKAYQAQIFATINSTQKQVDKSLTYELYGYNISDEKSEYWTPDKLAVFFTRKLATDSDSPLLGRIKIAPKVDEELEALGENKIWKVSTAVIVEGIMKLITSNPTKDSNYLLGEKTLKRMDLVKSNRNDKSPLRHLYLQNNDISIYKIIMNYVIACNTVFWKKAPKNSFIIKTVGIQALFDILKLRVSKAYDEDENVSIEYFINLLQPASIIDFTDDQFNASGSGRSKIRRALESKIN